MQKKVVAVVVNTSWNIYNFRMNIVKALTEQGYQVICIAPKDRYSDLLVSAGSIYVPVHMQNRGSNPIKDFLLCCTLWKLFGQYKPDVILQFTIKPNIYGTLAAKLRGIPVINNVSGLGTVFLTNNLSSKIAKFLYRIAFRFPFRVFFQNREDQDLFITHQLVPASLTEVIPGSGVNLARFSYVPFVRQQPFIFLMASRLIYDKGLIEYLAACKLVKQELGDQVECWLQGAPADSSSSGVSKEELSEVLARYPVRYFPFTDSIEEFVRKADVVVLPSYREGVSRLLLEAAALGKPLLATDVPGCREIVRDKFNGLLCQVKDSKDLARAMVELFNTSDDQLKLYSSNSRKLVEEEFSDAIVTDAYLKAVEDALKK